MNFTVVVTPNIVDDNPDDDTLTVRFDKHDGEWAGKLVRGKKYKAVAQYVVSGITYYQLEKLDEFPFPNPTHRQIWGNAQYLIKLEDVVPPEPEPEPIGDKTVLGVILVACKAIVKYLEP